MSDFLIRWAERLLAALVVMALIVVVIGGLSVMFSAPRGGIVPGVLTMIVGLLSVLVGAGVAFVSFGIYRNGQATNRLLCDLINQLPRPSA